MQKLSYYFAKFCKNYLKPKALRNCRIEKTARVCSGSELNDVELGRYSYIGHNCRINSCSIGAFCSIASDVVIGGSGHPIEWVSTSPVFHTKNNLFGMSFSDNNCNTKKTTYIENDVWIASNVIVKGGVTIGNGTVVGMGSVVTKDIPPYEIWAGNPARYIRKRFDEKTEKDLLETKWWDFNDEELNKLGNCFDCPEVLIERIRSDRRNER